jgi:hypothetical protein
VLSSPRPRERFPNSKCVVAKKRASGTAPVSAGWVKTKNRQYWRYDLERESALKRGRASDNSSNRGTVGRVGARGGFSSR